MFLQKSRNIPYNCSYMALTTLYDTNHRSRSLQHRFEDTLRAAKCSLTVPRRLVFEALLEGPTTPVNLAEALSRQIDRATVYRTVDLFERLGVVNRVWQGFKSHVELSEIFLPHHHHALCQRCGSVLDISSTELEQTLAKLARDYGFLTVEHSVELSGYCSECHAG